MSALEQTEELANLSAVFDHEDEIRKQQDYGNSCRE